MTPVTSRQMWLHNPINNLNIDVTMFMLHNPIMSYKTFTASIVFKSTIKLSFVDVKFYFLLYIFVNLLD